MGSTLGVTGIDAGVTFGTAGMVGTAVVCGFGVTGIEGAQGVGCAGCAGLAGAGCGMETWSLAGACGVAVVLSGTVSVGLTLCSHRWHLMWLHTGGISCGSKQYHHWCIPGSCPWVGCILL